MNKLMKALPPELHDAIRQMRASGMSLLVILMLALQYGPALVTFVQQLIEAWKSAPTPPATSVKGTCDPALAKALCDTQCALIEALYANHQACHAADCCPDGDDEEDEEDAG